MASDTINSSADDIKLTTRFSQLVSVGGFPAVLCATIGDLFGQKNGWLFVGLIGVIALTVAIYLLMSLTLVNDKKPFWYRLTSRDKELSWIWSSKPALLSHGVHVVALFGAICIFCAGKTYAARDTGGVLGTNIEAVATAQKQLGLTAQILEEQKKTNQELNSINTKASNFKKEISEDPRKELANLQIPWTAAGFIKSIRNSDTYAVRLFIASKFNGTDEGVTLFEAAVESGNDEIHGLLANYWKPLNSVRECSLYIFTNKAAKNIQRSQGSNLKLLMNRLCGDAATLSTLKKEFSESEAQYLSDVKTKRMCPRCTTCDSKDLCHILNKEYYETYKIISGAINK
jgi:hypothetical protein